MREKKITDISIFLGRSNIETKKLIAGSKSETVEIITSDKFLKILRDYKILKRWEDLDENLQVFLSLPSTNTHSADGYGNDKLTLS